jgi:hypothetical protein
MSDWISVKDRMPREIIDFVLVTRDNGRQGTMEANLIDGEFIVWRFGLKSAYKNPTHWMPYQSLPEPPKETNK